jgi:hypothetical protein
MEIKICWKFYPKFENYTSLSFYFPISILKILPIFQVFIEKDNMKNTNTETTVSKKIILTESQFERLSQNIINQAKINKTRR